MTNHKHFLKATITTLLAMQSALVFADTYNATTGLVSMPVVHVGDTSYHVTMMHQGNLNFQVTMADFATETSDTPDTYNAESGILYMPSVTVGSEIFEVTMQHNGDLNFSVISAEPADSSNQNTSTTSTSALEGAWCGGVGLMLVTGNTFQQFTLETDNEDNWWSNDPVQICGEDVYHLDPWMSGTLSEGEDFITGTSLSPELQLSATQVYFMTTHMFGTELSAQSSANNSRKSIYRIEADKLYLAGNWGADSEYPTEYYTPSEDRDWFDYYRENVNINSLPL